MISKSIKLRTATLEDIPEILALLSTGKAFGTQNLISIPESFLKQRIRQEIEKERLFLAVNSKDGSIVAQRKVFILEDIIEQDDIFTNLLRCTHKNRKLIQHGFFNHKHDFFEAPDKRHFIPHKKTLYLYVGSAYTHPAFRGKRISEQLNAYAYEHLKKNITLKIQKNSYTAIALIYAILEEHYYRTPSLIRPFFPFAQSISTMLGHQEAEKLSFYSYKMYKPDFIVCPKEGTLEQLPDEQSRLCRGCILLYDLAGIH